MFQITDKNLTMEDLLEDSQDYPVPELGSVIEGIVVGLKKNEIVIDLNGVTVGIISGRGTKDSAETIKDLKIGDEVKSVVIEPENDEGVVVLSLKKASQSNAWDRFEAAYKDQDVVEVVISQANK